MADQPENDPNTPAPIIGQVLAAVAVMGVIALFVIALTTEDGTSGWRGALRALLKIL